jgi:hypothetical protein
MALEPSLIVLHLAATWFMCGVLWIVQLVQYPMLGFHRDAAFIEAHAFHTRRITFVVGPAMLVQLGTALGLTLHGKPSDLSQIGFVVLGLTLIELALTGLVSVPIHNRLAKGYDAALHRSLVVTNWLRTAVWSAHAGFITLCVISFLSILI